MCLVAFSGLCLAPNVSQKRAVYAVVCETLKHTAVLKRILDASGFLETHPWVRTTYTRVSSFYFDWSALAASVVHGLQIPTSTALVLVYDHLLGQGVKAHGKVERIMLSFSAQFKQCQETLLAQNPGASSLSDLLPRHQRAGHDAEDAQHRFIRCNLIQTTPDEVVKQLIDPPLAWPARHQHHLEHKDIRKELGMPDVLALPPGIIVHDHPLVTGGAVVIQVR